MRKTIKNSTQNIKFEGISKIPSLKNLKEIEEKRMSLKKPQTKKKSNKLGKDKEVAEVRNKKKLILKQ